MKNYMMIMHGHKMRSKLRRGYEQRIKQHRAALAKQRKNY
jgi:hypothetical protein